MQVTEIIFLINAAFLVLFSLAVVVIKNPVRATFMLILSFLPTTAIYFFLHAPFVGILQILVYAGAILVLFTFVVMMVNPAPETAKFRRTVQSACLEAGSQLWVLFCFWVVCFCL